MADAAGRSRVTAGAIARYLLQFPEQIGLARGEFKVTPHSQDILARYDQTPKIRES